MTPLLAFQSIITWALMSGTFALGIHIALLTSDEFREKMTDLARKHMHTTAFKFGQQQGEKYGPIGWMWICFFLAPVAIPVFYVIGLVWIQSIRFKLALEIAKKARLEYLYRTGRGATVKGSAPISSALPGDFAESVKRGQQQLHAGMARVAWTALVLSDDEQTEWDELSDEMRSEHVKRVERVLTMPNYCEMLQEMLKAGTLNQQQHDALAVFALMVLACADGLHDNGICVYPNHDDSKVTAVPASQPTTQTAEEFPPDIQ